MSIRTPFNPLGTLGGGIELLDSVTVDTAADAGYENIVATALGAGFRLAPFGSESFFAEVDVENIRGVCKSAGHIATVGDFTSGIPGVLMLYAFGEGEAATFHKYTARASTPRNWSTMLLSQNDRDYESFSISHRIRNGVYSGEGPARNLTNEAVGPWTPAQAGSKSVYIGRMPGVSYGFKRLFAQTENEKFEALPARRGGKDGIAFFIDDKLKKFIAV